MNRIDGWNSVSVHGPHQFTSPLCTLNITSVQLFRGYIFIPLRQNTASILSPPRQFSRTLLSWLFFFFGMRAASDHSWQFKRRLSIGISRVGREAGGSQDQLGNVKCRKKEQSNTSTLLLFRLRLFTRL